MNILLLTDADVFAGTERHILDLAGALVAEGQTVTIACPVPAPLADKARTAGIRVLPVAKRRMPDFAAVQILAAELRAGRVDIIHAHNGRTHLLAVAAVKLAGRGRVVATQHFLAPNRTGRRGPGAWLAGRLHRWAEKNTAAFIAISQAVKDQMLIRGDARAEKITVVHNGTPEPEKTSAERIAALRAELGVGEGLMVFCAARLQKEKDIPTLIKAAGDLRLNDHGARSNDDEKLGARSWKLEGDDAGVRDEKLGVRSWELEDDDRLQGIDEKLGVRSEELEDGATPQASPAGPTESAALPQHSNSYLLTPNSSGNSFPQFFIAGEGDQRGECERLINDHGSRSSTKELGVRSWKLEDDDRLQVTGYRLQGTGDPQITGLAGQPAGRGPAAAGPTESAALPQHSNSYLLTSSSSQADGGAVRLLGFRSDVSALMASCDIFVLPAPAEPFGLVIIEAMALGKPVIAAGDGGPVEIVGDGETGLLFEPGNSESLAAAMKQLLTDADLRKRMGLAGRKRYEEMFTAQQMAGKMLAAYSVLISIDQYIQYIQY